MSRSHVARVHIRITLAVPGVSRAHVSLPSLDLRVATIDSGIQLGIDMTCKVYCVPVGDNAKGEKEAERDPNVCSSSCPTSKSSTIQRFHMAEQLRYVGYGKYPIDVARSSDAQRIRLLDLVSDGCNALRSILESRGPMR